MWIYKFLLCFLLLACSECDRNPLQDYQKSEGVRLIAAPESSRQMRIKQGSLLKCASMCSRGRRLRCRAFSYDHKNRKCHRFTFDSKTLHVGVEKDFNFDLYEKKEYVRECIVGRGQTYKGRRSVTLTGLQCQRWSKIIPHEHTFLPMNHKRKDLRKNFCRNPDNATSGPWCFTMDPLVRLQPCGLPQCSEVECVSCNGEKYRGPIDHTESGRECQRWDLDMPHRHTFQPKRYPGKGLSDNYCRNPDGRQRPWCYTTDPNVPWEYCRIKECENKTLSEDQTTLHCYRGRGEGYRGNVGVTPGGLICQRWDVQHPHNHSFTPQNYRCKGLQENYCRNPDGRERPWCFTTDPNIPFAFCDTIPHCDTETPKPEDCYKERGVSYRGSVAKTRSGIPCATWKGRPESFKSPDAAVLSTDPERSYCRNPDGDEHGPWCYTNNSFILWDYCKIQPCEPSINSLPQTREGANKTGCVIHKTVRIVGGVPVQPGDGSWMVSIQKGNSHWCGGSLIREHWVLTDQQCFSSCVPDLTEYKVILGAGHLNASVDSSHGKQERQEVSIAYILCGPEGSSIAMLRLSQPALLTSNVRLILLPVAGCAIPEGTTCTMFGWGETKGTGHEDVLKEVKLPMVGIQKCKEKHTRTLQLADNRVCAGGRKDEGVCERDYGGSLVCEDRGIKVIIGVSVHGRGCARQNRPGIFVNVAYYANWIHKVYRHYPEQNN